MAILGRCRLKIIFLAFSMLIFFVLFGNTRWSSVACCSGDGQSFLDRSIDCTKPYLLLLLLLQLVLLILFFFFFFFFFCL
jgi:hypothetical protein